MNARTVLFRSIALLHLGLIPAAAVAQSSIGPVRLVPVGFGVKSTTTAGSLAYFTTLDPISAYPVLQFNEGFKRSDGTPQGTFSIDPRGPVPPQTPQPIIRFADSLGDLVFFTTAKNTAPNDRGLWRSDGSVAGTITLTQGLSIGLDSTAEPPASQPVPERGLVFFSAGPRSGSPDLELWATDGTPAGTRLVKDVNPDGASNPRRMIVFDGRLFFVADTPQGRELWHSDGTPEGTERILDLHETGTGITLAQAGGALFVLVSSDSDLEIWRSDGTEPGTARVLELPATLRGYVAAERHLFLTAWDAVQYNEIWSVDGGTGESARVFQIETTQEIPLHAVGDHLSFFVEDDHGREPWWSDGTPGGTRRIDICPGPCSSNSYLLGTYGGRAVFGATDGVSGTEPWLTDGTAAGTFRLGDLCPGECDSFPRSAQVINGWLVLLDSERRVWITDGTRNGFWTVGRLNVYSPIPIALAGQILFPHFYDTYYAGPLMIDTLPVAAPAPPPGDWITSPRVPGFRFKVRIGQTLGRQEPACVLRTLCVSGAVQGHSEVFLRVSEPQPDGHRWPSLIKLTSSPVDVWIIQSSTGLLRHYRLNGSDVSGSTLPGFLDREGFLSAPAAAIAEAGEAKDPKPPGTWIESRTVPGFRVQARLTSNGTRRILRKEPCNIATAFCLSGMTPGVTDLFVRVTGPKPNGYFWPMLARFTPATLEVWIQQTKTKKVRYYRLNAPPAESTRLDGFFDRLGFKK